MAVGLSAVRGHRGMRIRKWRNCRRTVGGAGCGQSGLARGVSYDLQGDRIKRHREEIREAFGLRAGTEEDQERLAEWLTAGLCGVELSGDRLSEAVVARCRSDFVELPASAKVRRLAGRAVRDFDKRFCRSTVDRLPHATDRGWRVWSCAWAMLMAVRNPGVSWPAPGCGWLRRSPGRSVAGPGWCGHRRCR
ncbi:DUF4158 domain-containing protein [Streptacidiphilus sp. PAMC 29251]